MTWQRQRRMARALENARALGNCELETSGTDWDCGKLVIVHLYPVSAVTSVLSHQCCDISAVTHCCTYWEGQGTRRRPVSGPTQTADVSRCDPCQMQPISVGRPPKKKKTNSAGPQIRLLRQRLRNNVSSTHTCTYMYTHTHSRLKLDRSSI